MKLIGITGGIGAGKSTVAKEFKRLGCDVIDSDSVSRKIMNKGEKAYNEIVDYFGKEVLNQDNEINRKKLGSIVFNDEKKLDALNSITHRLIYNEIESLIKKSKKEIICIEIPLLFSTECPIDFDMTVTVSADEETRISRVVKRDSCSREEAVLKIKNQLSDRKMRELADCVIINNDNKSLVAKQVRRIIDKLK